VNNGYAAATSFGSISQYLIEIKREGPQSDLRAEAADFRTPGRMAWNTASRVCLWHNWKVRIAITTTTTTTTAATRSDN